MEPFTDIIQDHMFWSQCSQSRQVLLNQSGVAKEKAKFFKSVFGWSVNWVEVTSLDRWSTEKTHVAVINLNFVKQQEIKVEWALKDTRIAHRYCQQISDEGQTKTRMETNLQNGMEREI